MKLRPMFKCYGGKYYLAKKIIGLFPKNYPQYRYVETCGGAASVLLNKERSWHEVYNDLDPAVFGIFHHATTYPEAFLHTMKGFSYNEETFLWSKETPGPIAELVKRRMSRGGLGKEFAWSERLRGGKPGDVNAWETWKEQLPAILDRLKGVWLENQDCVEIIKRFDSPNTLFYVDPPYVHETRTSKNCYTYEMEGIKHSELLEVLNNCEGKVVLSGYECDLYCNELKHWNRTEFDVANHAGQGKVKQRRKEIVWRNYNE